MTTDTKESPASQLITRMKHGALVIKYPHNQPELYLKGTFANLINDGISPREWWGDRADAYMFPRNDAIGLAHKMCEEAKDKKSPTRYGIESIY